MPERKRWSESFELLRFIQDELEKLGYYFRPVERELTEAAITQPLVHRLRADIKKRGIAKVAGHEIIAFSGYSDDPREIWAIPEIRAFWKRLDTELPELPALLAFLPEFNFNGPGQYLLLLGEVDEVRLRPELLGYEAHVKGAEWIVAQALRRIQQAAARYSLRPAETNSLQQTFLSGCTNRF